MQLKSEFAISEESSQHTDCEEANSRIHYETDEEHSSEYTAEGDEYQEQQYYAGTTAEEDENQHQENSGGANYEGATGEESEEQTAYATAGHDNNSKGNATHREDFVGEQQSILFSDPEKIVKFIEKHAPKNLMEEVCYILHQIAFS